MVITRFAPSPNGLLHLGHAYAALFAHQAAQGAGGRFLVRIEDIDQGRARPEYEASIFDDLAWLGLDWEQPVRRQSEHMADYAAALAGLEGKDVIYPCFCTRRQIRDEIARSPSAPHGPDGPLYPGTCRRLAQVERAARIERGEAYALRLDVTEALARAGSGGSLAWHERQVGRTDAQPAILGDVVLARKDVPTSYHLAVTLDDHLQGVTLVTRGADLFHATHLHRLLQALLDLDVPEYQHHRLIADAGGERLAKRNDAASLRGLRAAGRSAGEVRRLVGFD